MRRLTKEARPPRISRDPRTGRALQQRNNYAVGVWRKVKAKLDGRDNEQNCKRKMLVQEQVFFILINSFICAIN